MRCVRTLVRYGFALASASVLVVGCAGDDDVGPDSSDSVVDDRGVDGGGETDAELDGATSGTCDLDRTRQLPDGGPIAEGAYCDDIVLCSPDAALAGDIEAAAPEFVCEAGSGDCATRCFYGGEGGSGDVTAAVMEQICAASVLLEEFDDITCYVYL